MKSIFLMFLGLLYTQSLVFAVEQKFFVGDTVFVRRNDPKLPRIEGLFTVKEVEIHKSRRILWFGDNPFYKIDNGDWILHIYVEGLVNEYCGLRPDESAVFKKAKYADEYGEPIIKAISTSGAVVLMNGEVFSHKDFKRPHQKRTLKEFWACGGN